MACRTMFISEPRISLENNDQRIVIQIDYGTVIQEDGRVPSDKELSFAHCLIKNIDWNKVTDVLREKGISGFKFVGDGWESEIFQTDKPDPYSIAGELPPLKTLEIRTGFIKEDDPFVSATNFLKSTVDYQVVKKSISNNGKYFHT